MTTHRFLGNLLLLTTSMVTGMNVEMSAQKRAPELQNKELAAKIAADGSFFINIRDKGITTSQALDQLREGLGVSDPYDFKLFSESEDALGYKHLSYQSNYAGIPIEEGMVLLHEKKDQVTHFNGHVAMLPDGFDTEPTLSQKEAMDIARKDLGLASDIPEPQVTLVIARLPAADKPSYILAYKVSIEGKKEMDQTYTKMNVFVDARSGLVTNKINLIAFTATQAQAHTLYSGEQTITTESDEDGYLLYDKARKIRTYNFEQATISSSGRIDKLLDYRNPATTWDKVFALDSVSWLAAGDTTLFPSNGSWTPLFYALTSPTAQFWTQGPIGDPAIRSRTPAQFGNIGLSLTNAPYHGFIRAYNVRSQQFLNIASFTLKDADITLGTHSWQDTLGNSGFYTIMMKANPALDVHWAMERTYDYYKEMFNRKSYDNRGGGIINLVNGALAYSGSQAQASALSDGYMVFGLGDRQTMTEVVSLDVVAHEFSHMVITNNGHGGLVYQGESGALNESFADIFGACIEFYAKGEKANWLIGEDIFLVSPYFFRSMSNPKATAVPNSASVAQPDTYQKEYWADPKAAYDEGGVHVNSGVQNKWFYLLCEGGKGTNDKNDDYQVTGIGIKKAEQIAYRNLTTYLTPYAQYMDAYRGSLQAAADLYGETGAEYAAVKAAWFAVGLEESTGIVQQKQVETSLKIYPNPATGQFVIASALDKTIAVAIVNVLGVCVQQLRVNPGTNNIIVIPSLAPGMYFLQYEHQGTVAMLKLSVK